MNDLESDVEATLGVVADNWTKLRGSDVYRLISQFASADWFNVGEVIAERRPDLSKRITEAVADLLQN